MKLLLVLILLLISNQINSLKTEDFCIKNKDRKCEAYECEKYFCSIDKISCDNLFRWKKMMKKYSIDNSKVYKTFIQNIMRCQKTDDSIDWIQKYHFIS